MTIVAAVDDRGGMTFNRRRQSQDRVLRQRILELVSEKGCRLWMNAYTRKQFGDLSTGEEALLMTDEDFLAKAPAGDWCYVENDDPVPFQERIEEIRLCCWNRRYPSDTGWELDMSEWLLFGTEEFAGSSHQKITISTYRRNEG